MSDTPGHPSRLSRRPEPSEGPAARLSALWRHGQEPDLKEFLAGAGLLSAAELTDVLCTDQRQRWLHGQRPEVEAYLALHGSFHPGAEPAIDLIFGEFLVRRELGECLTLDEYCRRFPELAAPLRLHVELDAMFATGRESPLHDHGVLPHIPGYEVEAVLGQGGAGVVFRARDLRLGRPVAIKMLLAGPYAGPTELMRFQLEAEAVAGLCHPNVVQIYEIGEHEGRPYFTMELVDGGSLAQKLAAAPVANTGGSQHVRWAARVSATLAEAVSVAHRSGIIHRDLKPGNVLLTADGTPKISDFGLARRLKGEGGLTWTGTAVGTPSYMAPEQASGTAGPVGPPADVYGLGAVLYELLTGRPPFRAESAAATIEQVVNRDPVPPSRLNANVPRDLETICLKCLHKDPRRRYATAAAFGADLDCFLRGEAIAACPEGPVRRLVRRVRRRPILSAAVTVSALLLVALLGVGLWVLTERSANRRATEAEEMAIEGAAGDDLNEMVEWLKKSSWPEARAALERAKGRLGVRGSAELRQRMDRGLRDIELGIRLDAILQDADDRRGGLPNRTSADEYAAAFRDAGFAEDYDDPDVVAARIRESHICDALVAALDQWASFTAVTRRVDWILKVTQKADPDSANWRERAGDSANWKDEEALAGLFKNARALPILLAIERQMAGNGQDTTAFVRRLQAAHPGDFRVNLRLGILLATRGKPDDAVRKANEAVRYYQAALAVRPGSVYVCYNFGDLLRKVGRSNEAVGQYERALELAPTNSNARICLIIILLETGQRSKADAYLRQLLSTDPKSIGGHYPLRAALIREGLVDEVLLGWKAAIEAYKHHDIHYGYAEFCLFLGREEEYRRARADLIAGFGRASNLNPHASERIARACLLRPATGDELRTAVALAAGAAAVDRSKYSGAYPYFLFANGLAEYREGKFALAISTMRGDASKVLGPAPRLVLAMALHRSGQTSEARKTLAAAVAAHDWRADQVRDQDDWIYHVLRREAEGMILPNLPAFLAGKYQPQDNDERLAFLGVCQFTNRTLALARLYTDAFATDPRLTEDPGTGHRYSAARAAALVGCGHGADATGLGEEERCRWRDRARLWLRADLATLSKSQTDAAIRDRVKQWLLSWQVNTDLAGLRDPAELAKLSEDERRDCLALWDEVADAIKRR